MELPHELQPQKQGGQLVLRRLHLLGQMRALLLDQLMPHWALGLLGQRWGREWRWW